MAKEIVAKTAFAECDAGLGELAGDKKMNLAERRNAIQAIFDSSTCGMVGIAEDANNNKWVVGYSANFGTARPLKIASTEGGTGKAFTDGNGTTVNIASSDNELAKVFTGTVPV